MPLLSPDADTPTDGTNPVEGAAVHVEVTTANARKQTRDGTTDANDETRFNYRVNSKRDDIGNSADATASKSGYNSSFGVNSRRVVQ